MFVRQAHRVLQQRHSMSTVCCNRDTAYRSCVTTETQHIDRVLQQRHGRHTVCCNRDKASRPAWPAR